MPSGSLDCTVVVVGAGIAGLAAALEVSKRFPDVTVVEAALRIGGRIKQVQFTRWLSEHCLIAVSTCGIRTLQCHLNITC